MNGIAVQNPTLNLKGIKARGTVLVCTDSACSQGCSPPETGPLGQCDPIPDLRDRKPLGVKISIGNIMKFLQVDCPVEVLY